MHFPSQGCNASPAEERDAMLSERMGWLLLGWNAWLSAKDGM